MGNAWDDAWGDAWVDGSWGAGDDAPTIKIAIALSVRTTISIPLEVP
jgi:hypothetical protein